MTTNTVNTSLAPELQISDWLNTTQPIFGISVKTRLMECDTEKINFYTDPKYW